MGHLTLMGYMFLFVWASLFFLSSIFLYRRLRIPLSKEIRVLIASNAIVGVLLCSWAITGSNCGWIDYETGSPNFDFWSSLSAVLKWVCLCGVIALLVLTAKAVAKGQIPLLTASLLIFVNALSVIAISIVVAFIN